MAVFTSTVRQLSHSTLNWDGQLNADMLALEQLLENSTHVDRGAAPADLNSALKPGTYRTNSGSTSYSNFPGGAYGYGTLLVLNGSGASVTQAYFSHGPNRVFYRTAYSTTDWTGWSLLAVSGDIDALNSRIAAEEGNRYNAVNDEGTARYNNDLNLQNQVNARATYDYVNGVRSELYGAYDGGRIDYRAENQMNNRGLSRIAAGGVPGVQNNTPVHVNFPSGRFPSGSSPVVVCTPNSGTSLSENFATAYNINDSGFDLLYTRSTNSSATINWIATLAG